MFYKINCTINCFDSLSSKAGMFQDVVLKHINQLFLCISLYTCTCGNKYIRTIATTVGKLKEILCRHFQHRNVMWHLERE